MTPTASTIHGPLGPGGPQRMPIPIKPRLGTVGTGAGAAGLGGKRAAGGATTSGAGPGAMASEATGSGATVATPGGAGWGRGAWAFNVAPHAGPHGGNRPASSAAIARPQ